jgi:hypothetical protein
MARLEDLDLDDSEFRSNPVTPVAGPSVEELIRRVQGALVGDEYQHAEEFLRSVLKQMQIKRRVSEAQRQAIERVLDRPYRGTSRDRRRAGW